MAWVLKSRAYLELQRRLDNVGVRNYFRNEREGK
jgi:hypothetical protein